MVYADWNEPIHVHVEHGERKAKFWVKPVALASSYRMKGTQLRRARALAEENQALIEREWNEYFKGKKK